MPDVRRLSAWILFLSLLLGLLLWLPLRMAIGGTDRSPLSVDDGGANVLLVGIDHRPGDWGIDFKEWPAEEVRSWADAMILVNIHGECITGVSIPRDTLANVEGVGRDRINKAMFHGGITRLQETVTQTLGLPVDRYVIVDFGGFTRFIDAIGGVEVEVTSPLELPDGSVWIEPGTHRLGGEEALRYVRHRYGTQRQDLDRIERQQQLLAALLDEVREDTLRRSMMLVMRSPDLFKTDLQLQEFWRIYRLAEGLQSDHAHFATLPGHLVQREFWQVDHEAWNDLRSRFLGEGPSRAPC